MLMTDDNYAQERLRLCLSSIKMGVNWDVTKEHHQAATILAQQISLLQSEKMASLGEMASGMAHEVNNPLAIINAKVSRIQVAVQRGRKDKDQLLSDLNQISATCLRISKIIGGLKSESFAGFDQRRRLWRPRGRH